MASNLIAGSCYRADVCVCVCVLGGSNPWSSKPWWLDHVGGSLLVSLRGGNNQGPSVFDPTPCLLGGLGLGRVVGRDARLRWC